MGYSPWRCKESDMTEATKYKHNKTLCYGAWINKINKTRHSPSHWRAYSLVEKTGIKLDTTHETMEAMIQVL